jgi:hypothetical protein
MRGSLFKGVVLGSVCSALVFVASSALAGSGIGGVFNLGQANTVNAQSQLTGSTAGSAQFQVNNTNTGPGSIGVRAIGASASAAVKGENSSTGAGVYGSSSGGFGVQAQGSSPTTAALQAQNSGGGTAGSFIVNSGVAPLKVNSTTKVANLNADQLDGLDSAALQKRVTGTCAVGTAVRVVNADGSVSCQSTGTGGGGGFTALTLLNGWTNAPFSTRNAVVENVGGIVHFAGAIGNGTSPVAFTLPAAFRPPTDVYVPVDLCNATNGRLYIQPNGTVNVQAEGNFANAQCFTSLEGASYALDPAAATHFTVSAPASANSGVAFAFTVTAKDQSNNTAVGYTGTVHFTTSAASFVLPADSTLTNGTATFSAILNTAGNQTITATDSLNNSITGTSNNIVISP